MQLWVEVETLAIISNKNKSQDTECQYTAIGPERNT